MSAPTLSTGKASAPPPGHHPRPTGPDSAREEFVRALRRNISAHGFLIGAVLCFSFFSWYPMVREFILAFQKTEDGRTTWAGLVQPELRLQRPGVLAGLAQHPALHRAGARPGIRRPVRRRRGAQRVPARAGIPSPAGLPARHAAAGRLGPALQVLLRPRLRTLQPHPGIPPSARPAMAPGPQHLHALRSDRLHLDEHGRGHAHLPRRPPGHPRRAVRGGRARRRGTPAQDLARHHPADPADPVAPAAHADHRDDAGLHRTVPAHQRPSAPRARPRPSSTSSTNTPSTSTTTAERRPSASSCWSSSRASPRCTYASAAAAKTRTGARRWHRTRLSPGADPARAGPAAGRPTRAASGP